MFKVYLPANFLGTRKQGARGHFSEPAWNLSYLRCTPTFHDLSDNRPYLFDALFDMVFTSISMQGNCSAQQTWGELFQQNVANLTLSCGTCCVLGRKQPRLSRTSNVNFYQFQQDRFWDPEDYSRPSPKRDPSG